MLFIDFRPQAHYTEIQNLNLNGLKCCRKVEWMAYFEVSMKLLCLNTQ